MLFSVGEVDALRLLRWCRYVSAQDLVSVFSEETLAVLLSFKLITRYEKGGAYVLTNAGHRFLNSYLPNMPPHVRPSYRESDFTKRSQTARFFLTAYQAGLSVFQTRPSCLEINGSCYLTAQGRGRGSNPWGSTRIAAVLRLGNLICGVHYVGEPAGQVVVSDEIRTFQNNTAHVKGTAHSFVYTGESYDSILSELAKPYDEGSKKRASYAEAFHRLPQPVFLIPSDRIGSQQLRIMCRADYRTRMTHAALGAAYHPSPTQYADWDAMFRGTAFLMAADMDLKRIDRAVQYAKADRFPPVYMVALKGQEKILLKRYKSTGLAQGVFTFKTDRPEIQRDLQLYVPPMRQFETEKGDVVLAPHL